VNIGKQIRELRWRYASLRPLRHGRRIVAIVLTIPGVKGGGSKARVYYRVLIDLRGFPYTNEPPVAWILYPPDKEICHLNIYKPKFFELLGRELPRICYGEFEDTWRELPTSKRTLYYLVSQIEYILNNENPDSPVPYRKRLCGYDC